MAYGLVKEGQRGVYDHFRNRLMFPIRDTSGNTVAFGGRALGDDAAKYINSPETDLYKKSHVLYGLYEGRNALRKARIMQCRKKSVSRLLQRNMGTQYGDKNCI